MIFLNQKMNLTKNELKEFIQHIKEKDIIIFPTMPLLSYASELLPNIGSQDVSEYVEGPYTGQTSIKTLKSLNVKYCLIGHHEKRQYLNENAEKMIKKIELCVENNITPIYIVGEKEKCSLTETTQIIEKQISEVFNNLHCKLNEIIIAYEPSWSIGINKIDAQQIKNVVSSIKSLVNDYYNISPKIIYGGGINSQNISELKNIETIDGYLIGSASIDYFEIEHIYRTVRDN